jgi:hypothetical protein
MSHITIDDIARDLGVSKTTISRAISGKGRISEATRIRVLDYIQACNYRPSAAAKGLAESRTYNLALVLPKSFIQLDLPYIRQAMNAICEEAFTWDYNILVCLSTDEQPDSLLRTLDNRKVDGVILSRTVENDKLVDILLERDIPFAFKTLTNLKAITSPLALIVLGGQSEFSAVRGMLKEITVATTARIVFAPVVALSGALVLSNLGMMPCGNGDIAAIIALFGSPVAVSSAIMATQMNNDEQLATQLVVWTTLFSALTIFLIACILMGFGLINA